MNARDSVLADTNDSIQSNELDEASPRRWVALAAALLFVSPGCGESSRAPSADANPGECVSLVGTATEPRPNLIFVLSDTLRRDRLGVYGGPAQTPAFDRFAEENIRFTAASTQAPWTKPSIATLFTGLYPSQHGVVSHPKLRGQKADDTVLESDVLAEDLVTFAEALSAAGYRTAAFVSNPWLQRELGFAQGFDHYDDSFAANATPGAVVTRAAMEWLDANDDDRPFFLYLHYMDAHSPYTEIPRATLEAQRQEIEADRRPLTDRARKTIAHWARDERGGLAIAHGVPPNRALMELLYDQGVERFDQSLADLLVELDARPATRQAAVVISSDHGEALFERGWGSHGNGLFENEVGVPLAMRLPGVGPEGPNGCPLGLLDLRATLCDYAGADCGEIGQGRSLLKESAGPEARVVISEGVIDRPRHRSVRDRRYKLVYEPDGRPGAGAIPARSKYALFDLVQDPGESTNLLAGRRTTEADAAFERLRDNLENGVIEIDRDAPEIRPLDDATRQRLEALGYVGDDQ